MKPCRLLTQCDTALRLLFTALISAAFILSALPAEAKNNVGVVSVSENSSSSDKRNSTLIAGAEEEVEVEETCNAQSRKQTVGGDYLLPTSIICCRTESLPSVSYFNVCIGGRHFQNRPLYILYMQLKVQPPLAF